MRVHSIATIATLSCCAVLSACASGTSGVGRSAEPPSIGWVHGPCIALADDAVVPGTSVTLVTLDPPQRTSAARVVRRAGAADGCPALLEDRGQANLADGLSFYRVEPADGDALAIGVLADAAIHPASSTLPDVDGDGRSDTFGHCATSEGIRFFVDANQDGRRLWSGYYHLGYDVQPDCPGTPPAG